MLSKSLIRKYLCLYTLLNHRALGQWTLPDIGRDIQFDWNTTRFYDDFGDVGLAFQGGEIGVVCETARLECETFGRPTREISLISSRDTLTHLCGDGDTKRPLFLLRLDDKLLGQSYSCFAKLARRMHISFGELQIPRKFCMPTQNKEINFFCPPPNQHGIVDYCKSFKDVYSNNYAIYRYMGYIHDGDILCGQHGDTGNKRVLVTYKNKEGETIQLKALVGEDRNPQPIIYNAPISIRDRDEFSQRKRSVILTCPRNTMAYGSKWYLLEIRKKGRSYGNWSEYAYYPSQPCEGQLARDIPDQLMARHAQVYKLFFRLQTGAAHVQLTNYIAVFAGKLTLSGQKENPSSDIYTSAVTAAFQPGPDYDFKVTYKWTDLHNGWTTDVQTIARNGYYKAEAFLSYTHNIPHMVLTETFTLYNISLKPPLSIKLVDNYKTPYFDRFGDEIEMPVDGDYATVLCQGNYCDPGDEYIVEDASDSGLVFRNSCNIITKEAFIRVKLTENNNYKCRYKNVTSNEMFELPIQLCSQQSQDCVGSPEDCPFPAFCYHRNEEKRDDIEPCRSINTKQDPSPDFQTSDYCFCSFTNDSCLTLQESFNEQYHFTWAAYSNAQKKCSAYTGQDQGKPYTFKNSKDESIRLKVNGVTAIYNQPVAVTRKKQSFEIHCPEETLTHKQNVTCEFRGTKASLVMKCDPTAGFFLPGGYFGNGSQICKLICHIDNGVTRVKLTNPLVIFDGTITLLKGGYDFNTGVFTGPGPVTAAFVPAPPPGFQLSYKWTHAESGWTQNGSSLLPPHPGSYDIEAVLTFKWCAPNIILTQTFKESNVIRMITTTPSTGKINAPFSKVPLAIGAAVFFATLRFIRDVHV